MSISYLDYSENFTIDFDFKLLVPRKKIKKLRYILAFSLNPYFYYFIA